jgi:hypothetical protein
MDARVKPGHDAEKIVERRTYVSAAVRARWHASHTFIGVAGMSM